MGEIEITKLLNNLGRNIHERIEYSITNTSQPLIQYPKK